MGKPVVYFTLKIWIQQNTKNNVEIINGTWTAEIVEKFSEIVEHMRGIEELTLDIAEGEPIE